MAFDLDKLKQNLSSDKLKGVFSRTKDAQREGMNWNWVSQNTKLEELKTGLRDIKNVVEERKFSLFVKQVVVVAAVFLLVRTVSGKLSAHQAELKDKMNAITIQTTNKEDYLVNKERLLHLEPLFPNMEQKSDWMPSALMALFGKHDLSPKIDGNFSENAQSVYTVVSQPISWQQSYKNLGQMLADMENAEPFLRVSEVSISKLTGKEVLGDNTITVKFNTIFPKEKYAPKLFKDYTKQMEKINSQKAAAATPASASVKTEGAK